MTAEEIIIDLEINDNGSGKSLEQLENRLNNLKSAIKGVAVGSEDFKKLQREIIKADSEVKNLNKSIEGLDTEALAGEIGKFAGGITAAFTGISAILGGTNEEFEQFTQKIVTGIALAQGIKGVTEAWTASQRLLNAALGANPIAKTIQIVAALATAIYVLIKATDGLTDSEKKAINTQRDLNNLQRESELTLEKLELQIISVNGSLDEQIAKQKEIINLEFADAIGDLVKEYGDLAPLLAENKLLFNQLAEAEKALNEETDKSSDRYKQLETQYENIDEALDKNIKNMERQVESAGKNRKDLDKLLREFETKTLLIEESKAKKLKLLDEQRIKNEKENNKKLIEERKKYLEELKKLEEKFADELKTNRNDFLNIERDFALLVVELNKETYEKEVALLEKKAELDLKINRKLFLEREAERRKELANILKISEEELKNEQKYKEAFSKLRTEEKEEVNKIVNDIELLNITNRVNQVALETVLNTEILKLQIERKDNFIDLLKQTQTANEELSVNLIKEVRQRNLKLLDLENKLIKEGISKEIEENSKLIESNEYRLFLSEGRIRSAKTLLETVEEELKLEKNKTEINKERVIELEKGVNFARTNLSIQELEEEILMGQINAIEEQNKVLNEKLKLQDETIKKAKEEVKAQSDIAVTNALITINQRRLSLVEGQWARERELVIDNLSLQTKLQLDALKTQYDEGLIVTEEYELAKKDIEDDFRKKKTQADIEGYKKAIEVGTQIFDDFQTIILNKTTDRINEQLAAERTRIDAEKEALDGQITAGLLTEEQKFDKLRSLDREFAKAERKAAYDQAKAERDQALIKIAIDTATAIVEAAPIIPLQLQAGILGLSQAAVVRSQPLPQLRRGARINGPSHEQGGVPLYKNGQQVAEVEGGELIMTKGVAQSPVLLNMASTLNQLAGGISFTNNTLPTSNASIPMMQSEVDIKAIVKETVMGITSIPVTNVATDTSRIDRKVKNIEAKSRF